MLAIFLLIKLLLKRIHYILYDLGIKKSQQQIQSNSLAIISKKHFNFCISIYLLISYLKGKNVNNKNNGYNTQYEKWVIHSSILSFKSARLHDDTTIYL